MSNILQPKIKSHSLHNCYLFQQKLHVDVILFVLRIGGFFAELDSYIHCLYSSSADFISSYLYMQDDLANAGWLTHLLLRFSLKPDLGSRNIPLGSFLLLWGAVLKFDSFSFKSGFRNTFVYGPLPPVIVHTGLGILSYLWQIQIYFFKSFCLKC